MDILIIGGTQFVGRDLVELLLQLGGHSITLFNRGKTNADLFPEVERITGDRYTDDIQQLAGRRWDAVVDCSGYFPDNVMDLARVLKGNVGRYVFISTVSVFPTDTTRDVPYTEDEPILECSPEAAVDKSMQYYGERKAECERRLLAEPGLDVVILRPALIFGPYDPFDRLYYWLCRAAKMDTILMPGKEEDVISYTYVRDLSRAIVQAITHKSAEKVYNLSTHTPVSLREMVRVSAGILNTSPKLVEVSAAFAEQHGLSQWADLPLWIDGRYLFNNTRARKELLPEITHLKDALEVTLKYYASLGWPVPKYGISREREEELLGVVNASEMPR